MGQVVGHAVAVESVRGSGLAAGVLYRLRGRVMSLGKQLPWVCGDVIFFQQAFQNAKGGIVDVFW